MQNLFTAPPGLANPHMQSILGSSALRRRRVLRAGETFLAAGEDLIADCGDGIRLLLHHHASVAADPRPVAVLIHGWEGSAQSSYVLSAATRLWASGFDIVRLNLRDHGDTVHLNRELFHSCRLDEVIGAVRWVQARFPDAPLHLGGFSLGGNFALRIAARAGVAGLRIARVFAVCPVLNPVRTMAALDGGAPIYQWYFMRKWRSSLTRKRAAFPDIYDFSELGRFSTLGDMTDYFVRQHTEYPDLLTYLRGYALTDGRLQSIECPGAILLAQDDPVIPIEDLAHLDVPRQIRIETTERGGHCGFIADYRLTSWADEFVRAACLTTHGNRSQS